MTTGSIVIEVCKAHNILPDEFFHPRARRQEVLACRVEAFLRLRDAGFNDAAIARVTRRHYDSVRYWIRPGNREHRIARMHRRAKRLKLQ